MTRAEIYTMLNAIGIPCVYHHFSEGSGQQPPFICFYYPNDNDFKADDTRYVRVDALTIELYTDNKDFTLEETVENALLGAGLVFTKTESYIDTEKMFMVVYETEVLINGQQN